jgi:hypothetical protein
MLDPVRCWNAAFCVDFRAAVKDAEDVSIVFHSIARHPRQISIAIRPKSQLCDATNKHANCPSLSPSARYDAASLSATQIQTVCLLSVLFARTCPYPRSLRFCIQLVVLARSRKWSNSKVTCHLFNFIVDRLPTLAGLVSDRALAADRRSR